MRLINVKAFVERERMISEGGRVDRRKKVLEFRDEDTAYAILSHRWIEHEGETTEVNYEEMIELAKMEKDDQDAVRQRLGYQKILNTCEQAKKDKFDWLWVDTCCIDKGSSAELSEAINSMYRWYENARVCYAYLHDVLGSSFPTESDGLKYPHSKGWPEWFSRGWTLQEMIAPSNLQFFNRDWQPIGDKKTLVHTLAGITGVSQTILMDGLSSNRPCVAQIMSWAANRTTTRVEDRAYSLLGLLDVNMPMLYGEGRRAFQRLQLEIIRVSNDQSIFAWDPFTEIRRPGSILADDPSFFRGCDQVELMDHDELIQYFKRDIPEQKLPSIKEDQFGVFPITNRGIQIWLPLRHCVGSSSVFEALLPCRIGSSGFPMAINLALWKSNYYRYFPSLQGDRFPTEGTLQFRQIYLTYQLDMPRFDTTFEIDDSGITDTGFSHLITFPIVPGGNNLTLTNDDPLCLKIYSDNTCRFAVVFGQCFGQYWIHLTHEIPARGHWKDYAYHEYEKMMARAPELAQPMAKARSGGEGYGRVYTMNTYLRESPWTVQISCITWENSRKRGVKVDLSDYRGFGDASGKWTGFDVCRTHDPNRDMRSLMLRDCPWGSRYGLCVDGVSMEFTPAPEGIKLGDYGHFTDSKDFCCEGNIFADLQFLYPELDTTPRQHEIRDKDKFGVDGNHMVTWSRNLSTLVARDRPLCLSLPSNSNFNLLLASLSTELANNYLITRVIQCATDHPSEWRRHFDFPPNSYIQSSSTQLSHGLASGLDTETITPLCTIARPLVWYRDDSVYG